MFKRNAPSAIAKRKILDVEEVPPPNTVEQADAILEKCAQILEMFYDIWRDANTRWDRSRRRCQICQRRKNTSTRIINHPPGSACVKAEEEEARAYAAWFSATESCHNIDTFLRQVKRLKTTRPEKA